jgi:glycogen debranching enzyme
LFKNFNEAFWDEEPGFYAYALDCEKKKMLSLASNVGQCLWSRIVAPERAGTLVKRLMRKDMWSGWACGVMDLPPKRRRRRAASAAQQAISC